MAQPEPDYRFTLANERTFLSWIRTSLALLAAGVAVVHLLPDLGPRSVRLGAGLVLGTLALVLSITSHRRWRQVEQSIRTGTPIARPWQPAVTAAGVSVTVLIALVLMVWQ